ncbi:MAG: 3-hydroxyacyl-ACP dehydratase FabZ family protein [Desulforhopalus sp.]
MTEPQEVISLIPHRQPFLWVDKILSFSGDTIVTEKTIPATLELFEGHYPGNPIMPGVLLCEAIFQSGALLIAKRERLAASPDSSAVPVLTRIKGARFKRSVLPGDTVQMTVRMTESVASAYFFKGTMRRDGKMTVQVDFACAISPTK